MIIDLLSELVNYESLNARFERVCEYLGTTDLASMEEGRYVIDGDDSYMTIVEKELKDPHAAALEVHNKYIDIQIVISGKEGFGWSGRRSCVKPKGDYSEENDILFFEDKPSTYFTLKAGECAVFFPGDAHAPLVGEGKVRKCIVKVRW